MSEVLRNGRLMDKRSARNEHACNLAERGARSRSTTAHVITGPEIDHEIERRIVERE